MVKTAPFGSWKSPITAESLSSSASANNICIDNATQSVYWYQTVPEEGGRGQIFSQHLHQEGTPTPLLPLEYNCRSRVHEYGGGAFNVKDGLLVFSNDKDCRVYTINLAKDPRTIVPLTSPNPLLRYGDFALDAAHRFIICIQEEHFENETPKDVINRLVTIHLDTGDVAVLASGNDFYSFPRLSPDGKTLAYVTWDHPNMPWDYTRLVRANLNYDNRLVLLSEEQVAGEPSGESFVQPEFGDDGTLYFATDRSGFWNLYRYVDGEAQLLLDKPVEAEFAGPAWGLNEAWYMPCKSDTSKLVCTYKGKLAILDTKAKTLTDLTTSLDTFSQIRTYASKGDEIIVLNGKSATTPAEVVSLTLNLQSPAAPAVRVLRKSQEPRLDPAYISIGKEHTFTTTNNLKSYCYFYLPKNPDYEGEGLPPLRLISHGGPTSRSDNSYSRSIQYWTTRGFAVADVNYGGSTGYGREYRNRLKKQWGVVDVDDCCNAALYLAEQGLVDKNKLAIEGQSAGGFTTLYPEEEKIYTERSPITAVKDVKVPIIFFHGSEDKVVLPNQSEDMVRAMKENGVPVAHVVYPGESHGFRKAENIKRTMELEQWFYGQFFDFPVEDVEGVVIFNKQ
ncbi:Dipeptidyl aminopeptidase [Apophysomyces sp. BC1034]|nr:Dipeptidyl aminopeptidase [Apophysomyces sp. BC1021]KAG0190713.1 Dipeptidyl aminopeptidase [Apophysomyces sp. BC1034]